MLVDIAPADIQVLALVDIAPADIQVLALVDIAPADIQVQASADSARIVDTGPMVCALLQQAGDHNHYRNVHPLHSDIHIVYNVEMQAQLPPHASPAHSWCKMHLPRTLVYDTPNKGS
jgi:hypothetical protein